MPTPLQLQRMQQIAKALNGGASPEDSAGASGRRPGAPNPWVNMAQQQVAAPGGLTDEQVMAEMQAAQEQGPTAAAAVAAKYPGRFQ